MRDLVKENMIDIRLFSVDLVTRRDSGGVEFSYPRNLASLDSKIVSLFSFWQAQEIIRTDVLSSKLSSQEKDESVIAIRPTKSMITIVHH